MAKKRTTFRRPLNLVDEAHRLFRDARARSDFSGAAAVLRLMRDLRATEPAASPDLPFDVNALNEAEFEELGTLLAALNEFKQRVNARLDPDTSPRPAPSEPIVALDPIDAPDPIEPIDPPFTLDDDEIELPDAEDL
jgi:hypothetical protein